MCVDAEEEYTNPPYFAIPKKGKKKKEIEEAKCETAE